MRRNFWPLILGVLALLVVLLIVAKAPVGFPTGEVVWIAILAILGWLVPYFLGLLKYSTWESRFWKTAVGYMISAAVAAIAMLIARVSSGAWPFDLNLAGLLTIGLAWVQFCYNAFVKSWLEKKALTRSP